MIDADGKKLSLTHRLNSNNMFIDSGAIGNYIDSSTSKNPLGYYEVGTQLFFSKIEALILASSTGQGVSWNFNRTLFDTINWSNPGPTDLTLQYQKRARQLREKYDYITLAYSGGSDSSTVLDAFLTSGIKPDEILVWWPLKGTENLYTPNPNRAVSNWYSEWDLSLKPDLEWIAANHPDIKITFCDTTANYSTKISDYEFRVINSHSPGSFSRFDVHSLHELKKIELGIRATTIWGYDKPQFAFKDNKLYFYFIDKLTYRFMGGTGNESCEFFYWSPDAVDIIRSQIWKVYESLICHPIRDKLLDCISWDNKSRDTKLREYRNTNKKMFDIFLRNIIYPRWNPEKYQTDKPQFHLDGVGDRDLWMWGRPEYKNRLESWKSELANIKGAVNKKYYQLNSKDQFEGWIGFTSPFYEIGPIYKTDYNPKLIV